MILVERDGPLPAAVEEVKAQVLLALQAMHAIREFEDRTDLARFLDDVLDGMAGMDVPRGLTRVILFFRSGWAHSEVKGRMLVGANLVEFTTPGCWMQLGKKLPTLTAWVRKIEPDWMTQMKGL
jgi:hypothetical protein